SVLYSLRFVHKVFFGPAPVGLPKKPQEAPFWMRAPIEVLVLGCLVVGVAPAYTIGPFLGSAVQALLQDQTPYYSLSIWHGFTQPLILSLTALAGGTAAYVFLRGRLERTSGAPVIRYFRGRRMFETVLAAVITISRKLEKFLGTRRLQSQLRILVAVASLAAVLPFVRYGYSLGPEAITPVHPGFMALWA